ncbi:Aste57867_16608 [Aphanomyces stellatus]|uniref:COMM domain-containing protein 5 n=1 Tax=Aphanomyces stellatus TaxID=120398 RepID=A0A485L5V5_9STRA|nr:hypothetical protein As57867_016551 [Aphanomyces stellatus]VFT93379.1 Aste57867_16608 [Aphanomyces stellatus]
MAASSLDEAVKRLGASIASHVQVDACAVLDILVHTYDQPENTPTDPAIHEMSSALRDVMTHFLRPHASMDESVLHKSGLTPRVVSSLLDSVARVQHAAKASVAAVPHLDRLDWRIDINVASSALDHIGQPSVVLRLQLSDGTIHTVALPLDKFHELRYNTAKILQEINQLERHPIMRLTVDGHTSL